LRPSSLGTAKPLAAIKQRLAARFEVDFSLHAVDHAIRTGTIKVAGKTSDLPLSWDQPLSDNGATIAVQLGELWGNGAQFDAILIGGGSAVSAITHAILNQFAHAEVIPEGQIAVALGYARLARRFGKRQ
jgi:hypothetical protein